MTGVKKKQGKRQTQYVPPGKSKRKVADGRPRGTFKKFPFEQTRLGFLLKYEMPVVYDIVMDKYKDPSCLRPLAEVIELVSKASKDPTYKKPKFRRYMDEYIATGTCCKRAKVLTPELRVYYESIRKRKMEAFIARNRSKIEKMKREFIKNSFKSDSEVNASQ